VVLSGIVGSIVNASRHSPFKPQPNGRRIVIFAGRFGSGKTEVSINYALSLVDEVTRRRPILIDLDVVTPYFRTRELAEQLAREGVDVVAPAAVAQHLDTPGITPEILGAIQQPERPVVIDVGGDAQGARALGQFALVLEDVGYAMNFVVNPYRPFTDSVDGIIQAVTEIQATCRLQATALVSNPNLIQETTVDTIMTVHRLVEEAAAALELPVVFVSLRADLATQLAADAFCQPMMPLRRFFVMPWEYNKGNSVQ
jgi:hypothetical protein